MNPPVFSPPAPAPVILAPKRRGKIARLPKALREQLNLMLDEGATYREIIEWLDNNGHPGFNQNNLYHWRYGGYQDWREERERAEQAHALRQWASSIAATEGTATLTRAIANFTAARMHGLLCTLDLPRLSEAIQSKPELCVRYFNSLLRTGRIALDADKFDTAHAAKEQKRQIIDPESFDQIARRMGLL